MQPSEAGKVKDLIKEVGEGGKLTYDEVREAIVAGWCQSVDKCLEDGVIDVDEEGKLLAMMNGFKCTAEDLDKTGAHTRLVKAAVIREVLYHLDPQISPIYLLFFRMTSPVRASRRPRYAMLSPARPTKK